SFPPPERKPYCLANSNTASASSASKSPNAVNSGRGELKGSNCFRSCPARASSTRTHLGDCRNFDLATSTSEPGSNRTFGGAHHTARGTVAIKFFTTDPHDKFNLSRIYHDERDNDSVTILTVFARYCPCLLVSSGNFLGGTTMPKT